MTKSTIIATNLAPAALGPYSQGVCTGSLVFCSGQIPLDHSGEIPSTIAEQTRQSLKNVAAVLEAGGAGLETTVKTLVFLKDMNDFAAMNEVYASFFPKDPPARSTIEVTRLPRDALVEIEAVAVAVTQR